MEITCSKIEQVQLFQKMKTFNYRKYSVVQNKKRTPVSQYGGSQGLATCVAAPNLKSTAIFANKYQLLLYHLGRHLARGVIFILKKEV